MTTNNHPVLISLAPDQWQLGEPLHYHGFTVPAGFVSDLDSVPRIPFVYSRYKGRTVRAAILHDYLYRNQIVSRKLADTIFLDSMQREGVPARYRIIIYAAVRLMGWLPWWRNQQ